ncbi:MAG: peptide deformylase [Proteobacteria bacterium]|nr:peptide deformylase [Pseudomonadota bacterium]MBU4296092.1 peptide deformylase [Pseudomonadota bacterium]MCG2748028.1 peptide deformylase [Desulfobulbaceae bacterium]
MAIREIIKYPDPLLRKKASPITEFNAELKELVADMAETMYAAPGVGLAANQIGVLLQIVVIDVSPKDDKNKLIPLINPEILEGEGSVIDEEGCLSVVDYAANVERFSQIKVCARDLEGREIEFEADGWFARVIQHEVDHLNGKLFIDHLSSLKRALYKKKRKKQLLIEEQERAENND